MSEEIYATPEDFAVAVGKNIEVAREEAGLTQSSLGDLVGQSDTTIRSWEKGRTSPRLTDLHKISSATKKSLACLLGIEKPAPDEPKRADEVAGTRGLVNPRSLVPGDTAKIDAGYFQFGGRRIRASMVFEATGTPPRFGGYGPGEPGADEEDT